MFMKKGAKVYIFIWVVLLVILFSVVFFNKITGNVVDEFEESEVSGENENFEELDENIENEASQELDVSDEKQCIKTCASEGCDASDLTCMQTNAITCMEECKIKKSEPAITSKNCTEDCLVQNCDSSDKICLEKNKYKCYKECGTIRAPAAKSEEDICIRECINNEDSSLTCIPEGDVSVEEICETCSKNCEQLYDGLCLQEIKLETKLKKCETCDDCYGSLVMGDSKEGYDCIVNVKCKDASSELGDDSGNGAGIGQEGFVANIGDAIGNVVEGIGDFFKGMFGGETSSEDKPVSSEKG